MLSTAARKPRTSSLNAPIAARGGPSVLVVDANGHELLGASGPPRRADHIAPDSNG